MNKSTGEQHGADAACKAVHTGSTPALVSTDYKQEYISLKRALSDLKRGKPSDISLEVLGYTMEEFATATEYLAADAFNRKERVEFIKELKKTGVNLFDAAWLKRELNQAREMMEIDSNPFWIAAERILENLLFNKESGVNYL